MDGASETASSAFAGGCRVTKKRARKQTDATGDAPPGRTVTITHPEKLMFPDDGITKGDLAAYYEMVAPVMIPHMRNRPVTMERYPQGIKAQSFWQKDVSKGFPAWLERVDAPKKDGVVHHPIVTDTPSLLWLANQNSITMHVWATRAPNLYHPDVCVFDLDPSRDDPAAVRRGAVILRDLLKELGLPSWIKTTGSKGFHVVVPLDGKADSGVVSSFAHGVGTLLVKLYPAIFTQEFSKADRGGKILIDTGRNGYSATFAAAYTVRAKPGAPVSAPCSWEEIEQNRVDPRSLSLRTMADRLQQVGDLWADLARRKRSLGRPLERLRAYL